MQRSVNKLFPLILFACLFVSCFQDAKEIDIVWDSNQGTMEVDGTVVDPIKRDFGWVSLPGEDSFTINADGSTHTIEFIPKSGYVFDGWSESEQCFEAHNYLANYSDNPLLYEAKVKRLNPPVFLGFHQFLCAYADEE